MTSTVDAPADFEPEIARARRPKALTLTLLGHLTHGEPLALSTATFLDVLARLGVSTHAARSTLARLVESGLLDRRRQGRETFYTLTEHGSAFLHAGNALAWRPAEAAWDGTWTVLAYSIPESRRALRLRLRSRLSWQGFGMLRSGIWIAPGRVEVSAALEDLDVLDNVTVFYGGAIAGPAKASDLIDEAYDLTEIANRYLRFTERWSDEQDSAPFPDELCACIVLRSEWQQLVQADPRLPADHLPADWPAEDAEKLFSLLYDRWAGPARKIGLEAAGLMALD